MGRANTRLNRRTFAALCAAAPAIAVAANATQAAPVQAFRALSARLTGFPASALERGFADALWQALADAGHAPALAALLRGEGGPDSAALEVEIAAAWYSGVLPAPAGAIVATLHDALIWQTLTFASPPSTCRAGWEEPPNAEAAR